MKKFIACISMIFALSAGVTAMAAPAASVTENSGNMGVTISDFGSINTVAVFNSDNEIVYANQNDAGFCDTELLFATALPVGEYTVKGNYLNQTDSSLKTASFTVSATTEEPETPETPEPIEMTSVDIATHGDVKTVGFQVDNFDASTHDAIEVTYTKESKNWKYTISLSAGTSITAEEGTDMKLAVMFVQVPTTVTNLKVKLVKQASAI